MKKIIPNITVVINDETERFAENKIIKANAFLANDELQITIPQPQKKDTSKNPPIHQGYCCVRVLKCDDFQLTMRVKRGEKISDKLDAIKLDLAKATETINEYNKVSEP